MKTFLMGRALCAATMLFCAQGVSADETWTSATGPFVYEKNSQGDALFRFTQFDGSVATLIVFDLEENFENRQTNDALWLGTAGPECDVEVWHPSGEQSPHWGRARVEWAELTGPSAFAVFLGDCFGSPDDGVILEADPVTE